MQLKILTYYQNRNFELQPTFTHTDKERSWFSTKYNYLYTIQDCTMGHSDGEPNNSNMVFYKIQHREAPATANQ